MSLPRFLAALAASLVFCVSAWAGEFGVVCPNELKSWIFERKEIAIIDVQSAAGFADHNYEGSQWVANAAALDALASRYAHSAEPVVVVSADGGAGAVAAAKRLADGGVAVSRVLILEEGIEGALAASGVCDCCNPAGKSK